MAELPIKKNKPLSKSVHVEKRPPKNEPSSLERPARIASIGAEFKLAVYDREGKQSEEIKLDKSVFDGGINKKVLYQAILCYQANKHQGNASTKTRGEVSGGGRKPWRQKGTGRARAGSTRSPLWKHGGVVFGPHPRERGYHLSKKIRLAALKASLNAKLNKENILLIDEVKLKNHKTKEMAQILSRLPNLSEGLKLKERTLGILELEPQDLRCLRNIENLEFIRPQDVTAYDVLRARKLLISKDSLKEIIKRITADKRDVASKKQ